MGSDRGVLTQCRAESIHAAVSASSSFTWIGGTAAVCQVGVVLTSVGDPVVVEGVGFEACGRLLVTSGPTTASQPVMAHRGTLRGRSAARGRRLHSPAAGRSAERDRLPVRWGKAADPAHCLVRRWPAGGDDLRQHVRRVRRASGLPGPGAAPRECQRHVGGEILYLIWRP